MSTNPQPEDELQPLRKVFIKLHGHNSKELNCPACSKAWKKLEQRLAAIIELRIVEARRDAYALGLKHGKHGIRITEDEHAQLHNDGQEAV